MQSQFIAVWFAFLHSANCQLGLFKSILMAMIGVRGTIARRDMQAIRQLMKSYTDGDYSQKSTAYKHFNTSINIPSQHSAALKKYIPVIHMCM